VVQRDIDYKKWLLGKNVLSVLGKKSVEVRL